MTTRALPRSASLDHYDCLTGRQKQQLYALSLVGDHEGAKRLLATYATHIMTERTLRLTCAMTLGARNAASERVALLRVGGTASCRESPFCGTPYVLVVGEATRLILEVRLGADRKFGRQTGSAWSPQLGKGLRAAGQLVCLQECVRLLVEHGWQREYVLKGKIA